LANSFSDAMLQNCGDSPQNIKAPIEYREFSLVPNFNLLKTLDLKKVGTGEIRLKGDFGVFVYDTEKYKSKYFNLKINKNLNEICELI
jgi:hypothetical protein